MIYVIHFIKNSLNEGRIILNNAKETSIDVTNERNETDVICDWNHEISGQCSYNFNTNSL